MKISSIHRRDIISQAIVDSRLITEFYADLDELIGHPAGTLVCEPFTNDDMEKYRQKYEELADDAALSDTVTRLGRVFYDEGTFTPRV
jgi:hypothetical protein